MMRACGIVLAVIAALGLAPDAGAEETQLKLHGYATLGAVYHDTQGVVYRRDISQSTAGAQAGQLAFTPDSMLAVQADYRDGDDWFATAQVVSRQDADNTFRPQLALANVGYRAGATHLHLGRMLLDMYLEGDAAEIGYANDMVRQPNVYFPRYIDGVGGDWTQPLGHGLLRWHGQAGWVTGTLVSNGAPYDTSGSATQDIGVDYLHADWTVRLSAGQSFLKRQTPDLQAGGAFDQALSAVPNRTQLLNKFSMAGRRISNRVFALGYDGAACRAQAGYTVFVSPYTPMQKYAYLRGAWRMGAVTPYAAYVKRWAARDFVGTGIPDGLSSQTDQLNVAISNGEAALLFNQYEVALGMRYDFMADYALKLQWEHIRFQDSQTLVDAHAAATSAQTRGFRNMNLYSLTLDMLF